MAQRTMTMTQRERVLAALRLEPVDRVPYVELLFDARVALQIAGRPERLTTDPAIVAALNRGLDSVRGPDLLDRDISRLVGRDNIAYWGAIGPFPGGVSYLLNPAQAHLGASADGIVKTREDVDRLVFREIDDAFWEPARQFVAHKDDFAACALLWLGIDPLWHSMGFEHFCLSLATDPGLVEYFLERITDWLAQVATGLCQLDFDFIWAADDIAYRTAPFFSPKAYRRRLLPYTRRVAEAITKPWIYHSDGNMLPLLDDLLSQGMNAIHPLEPGSMDLDDLKHRYGRRCALVGNIDIDLLVRGTPDEVRQQVRERIAQLGPNYGYLLSSSNTITEHCRPENVVAMVEALRDHGQYPLDVP